MRRLDLQQISLIVSVPLFLVGLAGLIAGSVDHYDFGYSDFGTASYGSSGYIDTSYLTKKQSIDVQRDIKPLIEAIEKKDRYELIALKTVPDPCARNDLISCGNIEAEIAKQYVEITFANRQQWEGAKPSLDLARRSVEIADRSVVVSGFAAVVSLASLVISILGYFQDRRKLTSN